MNRGWVLVVGLSLAVVTGCGKVPEPTYSSELVPAEGLVLFGSEPAADVDVVFTPEASNAAGSESHPAMGKTDSSGRFTMLSPPGGEVKEIEKYTGVMPGDYVVTFHKFVMPDGSAFTAEMAKTSGPMAMGAKDIIPVQFTNPVTSPLKAKIPSGGNLTLEYKLPEIKK